ncbi:hypothetical protein ACNHYB_10090 [Isoptericola jiangsuensis]|uniref:hypothetical protein n=1 Tax=Isoptericola jiangsuensis TaxID=548579 RepID=UPI003AAE9D45
MTVRPPAGSRANARADVPTRMVSGVAPAERRRLRPGRRTTRGARRQIGSLDEEDFAAMDAQDPADALVAAMAASTEPD